VSEVHRLERAGASPAAIARMLGLTRTSAEVIVRRIRAKRGAA
jgi:DNA-binding CsgD family transcriptional regulator